MPTMTESAMFAPIGKYPDTKYAAKKYADARRLLSGDRPEFCSHTHSCPSLSP